MRSLRAWTFSHHSVDSPALTVRHHPYSGPVVGRANGASWYIDRPRGVARRLQTIKHIVECHTDDSRHVLSADPATPAFGYDAKHFRPEIAVILFSVSASQAGKRLAGEAARDEVNLDIVDVSDVSMIGDSWEVFSEDLRCVCVDFREANRLDSAHHLSRKREAADAAEQIQMSNKTLHGTPRSVFRGFGR